MADWFFTPQEIDPEILERKKSSTGKVITLARVILHQAEDLHTGLGSHDRAVDRLRECARLINSYMAYLEKEKVSKPRQKRRGKTK